MTNEEAVAFLESLEASDEIKNPLALLESLRNANAEAKTNREALEEAQEKLTQLEGFRTDSKANAVVRELKAAGIKNAERVVKLMDTDNIDFADDGALTGFEESLETTRTAWPELFDKKRSAPQVEQFSKEEPQAEEDEIAAQIAQFRPSALR